MQAPALAAVVDAFAQQPHAVQPGASSVEAAQQQPPAHRLVPQSAAEAQGSPGEKRTHEPVPGRQAAQPSAAAVALQQKPPRHAPAAHAWEAEGAQGAPGGSSGEAEGDALGVPDGVADEDALPVLVAVRVAAAEVEALEEAVAVGEEEKVAAALHVGAAASPGCVQEEGHGHARQVALVEAPVAAEYVPTGQGAQLKVPIANACPAPHEVFPMSQFSSEMMSASASLRLYTSTV
jgi:hypothetical protein